MAVFANGYCPLSDGRNKSPLLRLMTVNEEFTYGVLFSGGRSLVSELAKPLGALLFTRSFTCNRHSDWNQSSILTCTRSSEVEQHGVIVYEIELLFSIVIRCRSQVVAIQLQQDLTIRFSVKNTWRQEGVPGYRAYTGAIADLLMRLDDEMRDQGQCRHIRGTPRPSLGSRLVAKETQ